ncbi:hypothetical protein [Variovorax ginsengisoli]|uniref:Uncharacterized protein n=1 Tax=Variovorax ginsengisoli TaxID=363844 RepID=A0ABT8SBS8_9BURK|nr:hypothetical protein [Variovorax ginsengisoli]MDN8617201.1 hypothetical protein [Variovorax ginsengisoli]MDO1536371.1 hypothetical protein [Variovorax ginsengisoli]
MKRAHTHSTSGRMRAKSSRPTLPQTFITATHRMSAESTRPLKPEEAFRNAYWYFVEALETLAADPEAQCDAMGDCNVGWEIKDDVAAGRYLAG